MHFLKYKFSPQVLSNQKLSIQSYLNYLQESKIFFRMFLQKNTVLQIQLYDVLLKIVNIINHTS